LHSSIFGRNRFAGKILSIRFYLKGERGGKENEENDEKDTHYV
jgi:hypothetical protein